MVSPGPRATFQILPCLDSDELAAARRRELDIPRDVARVLGRSAVAAARAGRYRLDDGREVEWADAVRAAVAAKVSIPPDARLPAPVRTRPHLPAPARTRSHLPAPE